MTLVCVTTAHWSVVDDDSWSACGGSSNGNSDCCILGGNKHSVGLICTTSSSSLGGELADTLFLFQVEARGGVDERLIRDGLVAPFFDC